MRSLWTLPLYIQPWWKPFLLSFPNLSKYPRINGSRYCQNFLMSTKFMTRLLLPLKKVLIMLLNEKKMLYKHPGLNPSLSGSLSFTRLTLFPTPFPCSPRQRLPYHLQLPYFAIFHGIQNSFFWQMKMTRDHKTPPSHNYPIKHKSNRFVALLSIAQRIKWYLMIYETKWLPYNDYFTAYTSLHWIPPPQTPFIYHLSSPGNVSHFLYGYFFQRYACL